MRHRKSERLLSASVLFYPASRTASIHPRAPSILPAGAVLGAGLLEDLSQEWEIQGLLVGKGGGREATDRELGMENEPSRSVPAYRMRDDVSPEGGTRKGTEKPGSQSKRHSGHKDSAPQEPWLGNGGGGEGWGGHTRTGTRAVPTEAQGEQSPPPSPFMRPARPPPPVSGSASFEPPSARKSHFPATAGAREQLCEECPR